MLSGVVNLFTAEFDPFFFLLLLSTCSKFLKKKEVPEAKIQR